jgi:LacI family transcriptional regulator
MVVKGFSVKNKFQIKLSDIAERLSVSNVTVSKALRGHPDISTATAKKIRKLAQELGYVPNFLARSLSSRHSNTIGVIVPKIAHFFFSTVIEAIYDAAFENNYEIILTVSQENAEREKKHIQTLLSMRVDGIIISVSQQTQDHTLFETVRKMGVPLTFMDRVIDIKGYNTVVVDDRGGAFAATEHAVKLGYKKLAHIGGPLFTSIGLERLRGFKDALKKYKIPLDPAFVIHGGFSEEDGYKGFIKLYGTGRLPEFILAVSFPVALGIYRAAQELGLEVAKDFDVICFGNSGFNQFLRPRMTIVEQPATTLGRTAFELTLKNIQYPDDHQPQHIKLPTKLILCETCIKKLEKRKVK